MFNKKKIFLSMSLILIIFLVLGCSEESSKAELKDNKAQQQEQSKKQSSEARDTAIVRTAKIVAPAVVSIINKAYLGNILLGQRVAENGTGSGVIFDKRGYLVTNYHVVKDASALEVVLSDGRRFEGKLIGADPPTDIAVLQIPSDNLPVATFGDSDTLMLGEPAIAIGNPLGVEFHGTVTSGIISAVSRTIDIGDRKIRLIQTDAAINPGNSGGALANADGYVIGINSIKLVVQGVEGMGFAIPSNIVRPVVQSIIENGRVIRSYIGAGLLDKNTAARYGYNLRLEKGVYVAKLFPNAPAMKAGMQEGDVILDLNGKEVNTISELREILDSAPVGSQLNVAYVRGNQKINTVITLEEMPNTK